MLDRGLMPAGALFAGVVAHFIGAPSTVATMGAIVIVLTLAVAWRVPAIRAKPTWLFTEALADRASPVAGKALSCWRSELQ